MELEADSKHAEVVEVVKENEEVFRRLASSDLPIAEDAQRALQLLDDEGEP